LGKEKREKRGNSELTYKKGKKRRSGPQSKRSHKEEGLLRKRKRKFGMQSLYYIKEKEGGGVIYGGKVVGKSHYFNRTHYP